VLRVGNVLVTEIGTGIGGYGSELERTMIIGTATNRQKRYFEPMLEARQFAFDAIRPGGAMIPSGARRSAHLRIGG